MNSIHSDYCPITTLIELKIIHVYITHFIQVSVYFNQLIQEAISSIFAKNISDVCI